MSDAETPEIRSPGAAEAREDNRAAAQDEFATFAPETVAMLREGGVTIDEALAQEIADSLAGFSIATAASAEFGPPVVGPVWRNFLEAPPTSDAASAAVVHLVLTHLEGDPDSCAASLATVGFYLERTLLYALFRLGFALHDLGRAQLALDPGAGQRCFLLELDCFARLRAVANDLSRETRVLMFGMAGVAQTFLARTEHATAELATAGRADLVRSLELGNDPVGALQYLIELDVRLYDFDGQVEHLQAGLNRFDHQCREGAVSRGLLGIAAEAVLRLGENAEDRSTAQLWKPEELLGEAIRHYDGASELARAAVALPKQDALDRVRIDLLGVICAEKGRAAEAARDGTTTHDPSIAGIRARGLRLPGSITDRLRSGAGPSAVGFERVLDATRDACKAEPTPYSYECYARFLRARRVMTVEHSERVLSALNRAMDLGATGAENRTLAASEWAWVWRHTGRPDAFYNAVAAAALAAEIAPTWGWPLVLLAELAEEASSHGALRGGAWRGTVTSLSAEGEGFLSLVAAHDSGALLRLAAERATAGAKPQTLTLGGRSHAFVLRDPHGLLEQTFVLKPATPEIAELERDQTVTLNVFLQSPTLPDWLLVPRPVGILPQNDGACLYVMRREAGVDLASLIVRAAPGTHADHVREAVRRCVYFLAVIHAAWRREDDGSALARQRARRDASEDFRFRLKCLGYGQTQRDGMKLQWQTLVPEVAPPLPKRDAHAGNWIVTSPDRATGSGNHLSGLT